MYAIGIDIGTTSICGAALFGLVACGVFKNAGQAQKLIKYKK